MRKLKKGSDYVIKHTGFIQDVLHIYIGNEIFVYAGNATLRMCLAFFPLFMVVIAVFNMLPGYSPEDVTDVVFSFMPDLPEVKNLFLNIMSNLQEQTSFAIISVAAFMSIFTASFGVTGLQRGLRRISNAKSTNGFKRKAIAIGFTFALTILFPLILVFNLLGSALASRLKILFEETGLGSFADSIQNIIKMSGIMTAAISFVMILLIYKWLPAGGKRSLKGQLPGAVITALGWVIFTKLFSIFIPKFFSASIYGSLASFFLTAIWIEISINIMFVGYSINQVIHNRKKKRKALEAEAAAEAEAKEEEAVAEAEATTEAEAKEEEAAAEAEATSAAEEDPDHRTEQKP